MKDPRHIPFRLRPTGGSRHRSLIAGTCITASGFLPMSYTARFDSYWIGLLTTEVSMNPRLEPGIVAGSTKPVPDPPDCTEAAGGCPLLFRSFVTTASRSRRPHFVPAEATGPGSLG